MMSLFEANETVRRYFAVKAKQLATLGELPARAHAGLAGSHREEIQRLYLREILPRRFAVGRGIVYGTFHRSREADIVIWDADNYPSLPMADHNLFFADAVRVVIECKTSWSAADFTDMLAKSKAVRDIVPEVGMTLRDELAILAAQVDSLRGAGQYEGMLKAQHHVATAGVFLRGGATIDASFAAKQDEIGNGIDDEWPDILLLLEAGRVVTKDYDRESETGGVLRFFDLGEDALVFFTSGLLTLMGDRSVQFEAPLDLLRYALPVRPDFVAEVPFRLSRPAPMRRPIWSRQ